MTRFPFLILLLTCGLLVNVGRADDAADAAAKKVSAVVSLLDLVIDADEQTREGVPSRTDASRSERAALEGAGGRHSGATCRSAQGDPRRRIESVAPAGRTADDGVERSRGNADCPRAVCLRLTSQQGSTGGPRCTGRCRRRQRVAAGQGGIGGCRGLECGVSQRRAGVAGTTGSAGGSPDRVGRLSAVGTRTSSPSHRSSHAATRVGAANCSRRFRRSRSTRIGAQPQSVEAGGVVQE